MISLTGSQEFHLCVLDSIFPRLVFEQLPVAGASNAAVDALQQVCPECTEGPRLSEAKSSSAQSWQDWLDSVKVSSKPSSLARGWHQEDFRPCQLELVIGSKALGGLPKTAGREKNCRWCSALICTARAWSSEGDQKPCGPWPTSFRHIGQLQPSKISKQSAAAERLSKHRLDLRTDWSCPPVSLWSGWSGGVAGSPTSTCTPAVLSSVTWLDIVVGLWYMLISQR